MAEIILKVYEIQNIGKGVITNIQPENLLTIVESNSNLWKQDGNGITTVNGNNSATGSNSLSFGNYSVASGSYGSFAAGYEAKALGDSSYAYGDRTTASGNYSYAGGSQSTASGTYSFVHGNQSQANGNTTIVLGSNIIGNDANKTYVDGLNIKTIENGTPIFNLGIDSSGNVVTGTTGGGGGGISNTSDIGNIPMTTSGGNLINSIFNQSGPNLVVGGLVTITGSTTNVTFEGNTLSPLTSVSPIPWITQSAVVRNGSYAAKSGPIIDSQTTTMTYNITAPAGTSTFSCYWKVSSESGYNKLAIRNNGVDMMSPASGNIDWTLLTFNLTPSTVNQIDFTYSKDSSQSGGADSAYIDDITVFVPTGSSIGFGGNLVSPTISATTYYNLPVQPDIYVTGGTYSAGTAIFTNNAGGTFNISGFTTGGGGGTSYWSAGTGTDAIAIINQLVKFTEHQLDN